MSYFDHYIPPELIEIVVDQTNLYAQQQIAKMLRPIPKHARSEEWKSVTVIEMKKYLHFNGNNAAGANENHLYKIRTILDVVVNNFNAPYS